MEGKTSIQGWGMSDTPRTDAAIEEQLNAIGVTMGSYHLARTLERELAHAQSVIINRDNTISILQCALATMGQRLRDAQGVATINQGETLAAEIVRTADKGSKRPINDL
jgi:hypothetical protein